MISAIAPAALLAGEAQANFSDDTQMTVGVFRMLGIANIAIGHDVMIVTKCPTRNFDFPGHTAWSSSVG